jgi:hypothetical protein
MLGVSYSTYDDGRPFCKGYGLQQFVGMDYLHAAEVGQGVVVAAHQPATQTGAR